MGSTRHLIAKGNQSQTGRYRSYPELTTKVFKSQEIETERLAFACVDPTSEGVLPAWPDEVWCPTELYRDVHGVPASGHPAEF